MIVTKRANDPVWTNIYAYAKLPQELARLEELAHNLWWVWSSWMSSQQSTTTTEPT